MSCSCHKKRCVPQCTRRCVGEIKYKMYETCCYDVVKVCSYCGCEYDHSQHCGCPQCGMMDDPPGDPPRGFGRGFGEFGRGFGRFGGGFGRFGGGFGFPFRRRFFPGFAFGFPFEEEEEFEDFI